MVGVYPVRAPLIQKLKQFVKLINKMQGDGTKPLCRTIHDNLIGGTPPMVEFQQRYNARVEYIKTTTKNGIAA
ncbi:hypothetical protein P886_1460 [Alteromonadaceae bacterium 2753L.S.0a.02]|nr:hypothetical protein P886_1460 [Alteromonadaceae bacterium 2753L.S.0a.02]